MKNKGFTLIELLAVILILGIIALIAIPAVSSVIDQVRKGAASQTGNQIIASYEQYKQACELNGGKDFNGNTCYSNLASSPLSKEDIANALGIKGDIPEKEDILLLRQNESDVSIIYRKDGFACSNLVDAEGNVSYINTGIINNKGVVCEKVQITNTGTIILNTDGSINYLKSYHNTEVDINDFTTTITKYNGSIINEDFRSDTYRDTIYEIEFTNTNVVPETAITSWDLSESQNGSIKGWLVPIESGKNKLYIGSKGMIYANRDSFGLFGLMTNLSKISFGNFYTNDVQNMAYMFFKCYSLETLDLSEWKTTNVTTIVRMFNDAYNLKTVDLTGWRTPNLVGIDHLFSATDNDMHIENIPGLKDLNVSHVIDMSGTFYACVSIKTIDLSGWDTSSVENMYAFFTRCSELTTIYVGNNWSVDNVTNSAGMFQHAKKLRDYNYKNIDKAFANTSATGYLTLKD